MFPVSLRRRPTGFDLNPCYFYILFIYYLAIIVVL